MSMRDRIQELVNKGDLTYLKPENPDFPLMRDVFVSREVKALLDGTPARFAGPAGTATAIFDRFAAGGHVTMGMDPHDKDSGAIFARNGPVDKGVCDLRVLDPKPQLRIFGCFAEKDLFVGLIYQQRNLLNFLFAVQRCERQWKHLFGDLKPVVSENINDYISKPVTAV